MDEQPTDPPRLALHNSLDLYARAGQLIPGGTQTRSKRPTEYALGAYPIYINRADGARVWDVDGNEYLDYVLGLGPIVLGYNYPPVMQAIRRQLDRGVLLGPLTPLEVQAAELLVAAVPCAEMVRFFKGGAEANAAAARLARACTGRDKIVNCGYRGWHDQWAVADDATSRGIPAALKAFTLTFPYGDLAALAALFAAHPDQIAAVMVEPATIDGGSAEFLAGLRELTTRHGALLVFDEIVTGFRLALGGAQAYFQVTPDLAVFAKALANGMPLAAVAGRRDVMALAADLFITLTYGDEALSLAAAIATLEALQAHEVPAQLWRTGTQLLAGLDQAAQAAGVPLQSRGLAPMARLALDEPALTAWGVTAGQVWTFILQEMARRGVLWRRGGILFVSYAHTAADLAQTVRAAGEVFAALRDALDAGQLLARTYAHQPPAAQRSVR